MIRFGLRLSLAGGREALTRLVLITVAVAIGAGMLLTTLASVNAVNRQNARYAWLETGYTAGHAPSVATDSTQPAALWWWLRADYFHGRLIGRVDLAATGASSPVPPGLSALPGPGEYYASPALARLLRSTPASQLADRYPGRLIGIIGPSALPAPTTLVIVIGRRPAELEHQDGVDRVTRISTTVPSSCHGDCAVGVGTDSNGITLILSVVAAALLFPVLIFIGGATRLSAARREQRFAAMRLVGATPSQISVIAAVESAVAAVLGVALGFGLFFALRHPIALIPFTGERFFTSDLSLSLVDVLAVAVGIPVAAAVAARLALRRVSISPLGVTRRVTPRPPRVWRLVPLLVGIGGLAYFAYVHDIGATTGTDTMVEALVFLSGVLLVMTGLVVAGPWLTALAAQFAARRARRVASLVAARRTADDPRAAFRAISGLVLAVFVGTCSIAIITAIAAADGAHSPLGHGAKGTLIESLSDRPDATGPTVIAASTTARLRATSGVRGLALIRHRPNPQPLPPRGGSGGGQVNYDVIQQVVSCAELARVPALGHCPAGASVVEISPDYGGGLVGRSALADTTWPAVELSAAQLAGLPIDTLAVATDGSSAAVERARTVLDVTGTQVFAAQTIGELRSNSSRLIDGYRQLANVVILTSLPIAGCSLAVNIAGGLAERKRPFSLLRLTGVPLAVLRRVIALEAAAPLLITAALSVGSGLLAAHLFLRAQLHEGLRPLGVEYYLVISAGLLASLAVIASSLPLLERFTGPEAARND